MCAPQKDKDHQPKQAVPWFPARFRGLLGLKDGIVNAHHQNAKIDDEKGPWCQDESPEMKQEILFRDPSSNDKERDHR